MTWCYEQVCLKVVKKRSFAVFSFFQRKAIDEVKEEEKAGKKNAVAGDAKYDSPGKRL